MSCCNSEHSHFDLKIVLESIDWTLCFPSPSHLFVIFVTVALSLSLHHSLQPALSALLPGPWRLKSPCVILFLVSKCPWCFWLISCYFSSSVFRPSRQSSKPGSCKPVPSISFLNAQILLFCLILNFQSPDSLAREPKLFLLVLRCRWSCTALGHLEKS